MAGVAVISDCGRYRYRLERLHERVTVFLAEPVNCGPGAAEAAAFRAGLAEIHGDAP